MVETKPLLNSHFNSEKRARYGFPAGRHGGFIAHFIPSKIVVTFPSPVYKTTSVSSPPQLFCFLLTDDEISIFILPSSGVHIVKNWTPRLTQPQTNSLQRICMCLQRWATRTIWITGVDVPPPPRSWRANLGSWRFPYITQLVFITPSWRN